MADPSVSGGTALLILDMMNTLAFPGAERLRPAAEAAARAIRSLRDQADAAEVPVLYVNDNHGDWHDSREDLIARCLEPDCAGRTIAESLRPRDRDLFVIKPQFSGFYATNLPVILPQLGVGRLIVTGVAADICVLFTAADAHMRDYDLWIPADAVASEDPQRTEWALEIMRSSMNADTSPSDRRPPSDWLDATAAS
ncbi:cysteine hydrolase family protein [Sphingomonas abaci]|uniref:Nicotinamidase-related amidase n=1 Tax=Sphingomonas abaci TaxID=237611 RepID=A0A7W7AHF6_9SPHN|nr:isochorismatase family cysteine hydrolase [Sphingomonas abaci]MBB4617078.1 nicotinamidase-related amidase [Sphingomonas abaci]